MNEKKMTLWEPLRDLVNIRGDFDRLFDNFFGRMPREIDEFWSPVLDVVENNGNIEVRAELPGMKKEDIKVMVRDNMLSVSGERKQEKESNDKTYHRIERSYGKFFRSIQLPAEVEADKIKAVYKDGVLSVTLPKPESIKPKEIDVEIK